MLTRLERPWNGFKSSSHKTGKTIRSFLLATELFQCKTTRPADFTSHSYDFSKYSALYCLLFQLAHVYIHTCRILLDIMYIIKYLQHRHFERTCNATNSYARAAVNQLVIRAIKPIPTRFPWGMLWQWLCDDGSVSLEKAVLLHTRTPHSKGTNCCSLANLRMARNATIRTWQTSQMNSNDTSVSTEKDSSCDLIYSNNPAK